MGLQRTALALTTHVRRLPIQLLERRLREKCWITTKVKKQVWLRRLHKGPRTLPKRMFARSQ